MLTYGFRPPNGAEHVAAPTVEFLLRSPAATRDLLLSIVVPFHNSWHKADRLMATLARINDEHIEAVLVDDGSTDDTASRLDGVAAELPFDVTVLRQANSGPGGARNAGLARARGRYIWFVDSDDDIFLEAVDVLRGVAAHNYDFVDFNYTSGQGIIDTMGLNAGEHRVSETDRQGHILGFGNLWTKIFKKSFLVGNRIRYLEHCVFEDNFVGFIAPLATRSFYKSHVMGYYYNEAGPSITRDGELYTPRFFDRMLTASLGFQEAMKRGLSRPERRAIERMFNQLFLVNTLRVTRIPGRSWLVALRIMKAWREERRKLAVSARPFESLNKGPAVRAVFSLLYAASAMLPSQTGYFSARRKLAWGGALIR